MFNFFNNRSEEAKYQWVNAKPYSHLVIDDFLPFDIAEKVAKEFPGADSGFWYEYANP